MLKKGETIGPAQIGLLREVYSTLPNAKVKVIWTNSWFDPGKEREAALTLITQGADMLTHATDSTRSGWIPNRRPAKSSIPGYR